MNYGATSVPFSPVHFWKDATGGGHKRESVVYGIHFPISRSWLLPTCAAQSSELGQNRGEDIIEHIFIHE